MEHLLVSHWHKNTRYEIQSINGTEYIVPCEYGSVYDPIKSENSMMTDALNLGKYLTENDLGQNEMVLDFVHKYGLLGIMPDIAGSDIGKNERGIVRDNIFTESGIVDVNEFAKTFFPLDNIDLLDKSNKKGKLIRSRSVPASTAESCSMQKTFAASFVQHVAAINIMYTNQEQSIDALLFLFQNKNGGLDK